MTIKSGKQKLLGGVRVLRESGSVPKAQLVKQLARRNALSGTPAVCVVPIPQ